MARITVRDIQAMKERGERIPMVTAYDYPSARLAEEAGIPILLVGDSLGMVVLGYETTLPVTMEEMLHHTRAVVRGTQRALVVMDLPFLAYQVSPERALDNAGRALKEGGAQAVKVEGGQEVAETIRRMVSAGIPVMGHLGFTPQSVHRLGGPRSRGRTAEEARQLLEDALAVESAGAFALVLELVPAQVSAVIAQRLRIPVIGIGAGPYCDGQVQVFHDLLGLFPDFVPRHARQYARLGEAIRNALSAYVQEVRSGAFPSERESPWLKGDALAEVQEALGGAG